MTLDTYGVLPDRRYSGILVSNARISDPRGSGCLVSRAALHSAGGGVPAAA